MIVLLIFLTMLCKPTNNISINELIIPNHIYANYTIYFVNLIQVYGARYHRVYHIDTKSKDVYDDTIRHIRRTAARSTFSIFNYDNINQENFTRPNAARILHVVYTSNPIYWNIFTKPYAVIYRDVTIFVSTKISDESRKMYTKAKAVRLSGKVLVIEVANSSFDGIFLYQICLYCGNLSKLLIPVLGEPKNTTLLPYNYKNLNGHELHLTFTKNYPFIYCINHDNIIHKKIPVQLCTTLSGIESHMVKLISKKMNFTFKVYTEDWQNTSFINMLTSITQNKFDFAFGSISLTLNRRKIIQFTITYNVENYNLLYKVSLSFNELVKKFFDPFSDLMLWVLFLSAQFVLVLLLVLIQKLERQVQRRKTLVECFWLLLQIQLEQSSSTISTPIDLTKHPPTALKMLTKYTSSLLLLWCLTCLVLCSAYKGVTLSTLLRPPKAEPQALVELIDRGYGIAANYKSSDIVKDLMYGLHSEPNVYFGSDNCDVFSKVQTSKVAMLNEWSVLQFQLKKNCPEINPKIETVMRIARKPVRNAGHAWATQQGAPYKTALDYYLSLILSGGLYVKWTRDHTYSLSKNIRPFRLSRETQKSMQMVPLPLYAFYPLFIIYFGGVVLAFAVFAAEVLYYHLYHCRMQNIINRDKD